MILNWKRAAASRLRSGWRCYFIFLLVVLTALMLGMTIGAGNWLFSVALFVIVLAVLYPIEVAFGAFVVLIPFDSIAAIGQADHGRTLTWFAGAAATSVLLCTGLITRRLKAPPSASRWWILFVSWYAMTALWALNPQLSWQRLSTAVALLGLYVASSCFRFSQRELQTIAGLTILGGLVAAIWTIYLFYHGEYADAATMRASLIWGSREANPNDLGMVLLLPISLSFGYFLSSRGWFRKVILLGLMVTTTSGLLVTMSRDAFVSLLTMLGVYLYRRKAGWRILVPLSVLAILLSFMPSTLFERFQEAGESGGAGRMDIWQVGLTSLAHYGFLGAGMENFPAAYAQYAGQAAHFRGSYRDPHNVYLCVAVEGGVLGLFLFAGAIRSQLRAAWNVENHGALRTLLLATEAGTWGMLAFGFFGNNLWQKSFWFSWMLLTAAVTTASEAPGTALKTPAPEHSPARGQDDYSVVHPVSFQY